LGIWEGWKEMKGKERVGNREERKGEGRQGEGTKTGRKRREGIGEGKGARELGKGR